MNPLLVGCRNGEHSLKPRSCEIRRILLETRNETHGLKNVCLEWLERCEISIPFGLITLHSTDGGGGNQDNDGLRNPESRPVKGDLSLPYQGQVLVAIFGLTGQNYGLAALDGIS